MEMAKSSRGHGTEGSLWEFILAKTYKHNRFAKMIPALVIKRHYVNTYQTSKQLNVG